MTKQGERWSCRIQDYSKCLNVYGLIIHFNRYPPAKVKRIKFNKSIEKREYDGLRRDRNFISHKRPHRPAAVFMRR